MVFKTAEQLIDSYLNKAEFLMLIDVELPEHEWTRVREYCFDNSLNNPELYALLAEMYIYGLGVNFDEVLAKSSCESGIKKGSINCHYVLGLMYYYGRGKLQSYEEAIPYYEESAKKGCWRAQFKLGVCYAVPRGVKLDHKRAFELFLPVAKLGFSPAQFNVGRYIYQDKILYEPKSDCIKWLELAANQNMEVAMEYLGDAYFNGYYVEKNLETGFDWYMKSAVYNNVGAVLKIAELYEKGIFVEQSYQKAFEYYSRANAVDNYEGNAKVREYSKNQCHHCKAFFTKTYVKNLFGEKTICSACKKNYY